MLTTQQLQAFGLSEAHLVPVQQGHKTFLMEQKSLTAFLQLQAAAAQAGFDLSLLSSYRNFDRQAVIWNGKAQGQRTLLGENGEVLAYEALSQAELLHVILRWSAVPGLSRHHWGCDIDIFDANAMNIDEVQLVPAEVEEGGPCAAMHQWLDQQIANNRSFGFFRPYSNQACQVAEEKWHLSYWPVAKKMQQQIQSSAVRELWREKELCLFELLERNAERIIQDYARLDFSRLPQWLV